MLILFELIFDCPFAYGRVLFHLFYDFVIDRHGVKTNYQSYNLRLNSFDVLEKFELSELRNCDPFLWVSHQHSLNNFDSLNTDITG